MQKDLLFFLYGRHRNKILFTVPYILFFVAAVVSSLPANAVEYDLRFPKFDIHIEQQHLDALTANPYRDSYYPATLFYGDISMSCEVRFREASSRNYPKKNWKIRFPDSQNIFNENVLNFNAQNLDKTCMRDFLTYSLFQCLGYPSSEISFVNLYINDNHAGLYLKTEQVDELFLEKRGRAENDLYKSTKHAANMTPLSHDSDYPIVFEKKIGDKSDYDALKLFLSKAKYWTEKDFAEQIDNEIDVDEFLEYFAVLFAIASADNFCKNYYIYLNPETGKYELFPWDNDASFGNDWQGKYLEVYETFLTGTFLDYQTIFRRLMCYEKWRVLYWEAVQRVVETGFPYIEKLIDQVSAEVKHDLYADDSSDSKEFDEALGILKRFITNRAEFLKTADFLYPAGISDISCSNPMPDRNNSNVTFTVKAEGKQKIYAVYSTDIDFVTFSAKYTENYLRLYDDGRHDDGERGDSVYGNSIKLPIDFSGLVPYMFISDGLTFPENGFLYIDKYRTHVLMLNGENRDSTQLDNLSIGDVYYFDGDYFVEIKNGADVALDISNCYIQSGDYYQRTVMPENTVLSPGETIVASTNTSRAAAFFSDTDIIENAICEPGICSEISLLKPDYSIITSRDCSAYKTIEHDQYNIVINEIYYNAVDSFDMGDWIEIYNMEDIPVDLTGWFLSDGNDNHKYVFPIGTVIEPDAYLVISERRRAFWRFFPGVELARGHLDFGLSGGGEKIRLFDYKQSIIDSLTYDDKKPWPEKPDTGGSSLSLRNPYLDNSVPSSWAASKGQGTPGKKMMCLRRKSMTIWKQATIIPIRSRQRQLSRSPFWKKNESVLMFTIFPDN